MIGVVYVDGDHYKWEEANSYAVDEFGNLVLLTEENGDVIAIIKGSYWNIIRIKKEVK